MSQPHDRGSEPLYRRTATNETREPRERERNEQKTMGIYRVGKGQVVHVFSTPEAPGSREDVFDFDEVERITVIDGVLNLTVTGDTMFLMAPGQWSYVTVGGFDGDTDDTTERN